MFLRLAAACLIFVWTAGSAAEAEQCHGNPGALSTSLGVAKAERWAATLEASAASSARWAGWASPWLVQTVHSSLPAAKAEQWAVTLETAAGTTSRWAGGASPWLVQANDSSCL